MKVLARVIGSWHCRRMRTLLIHIPSSFVQQMSSVRKSFCVCCTKGLECEVM